MRLLCDMLESFQFHDNHLPDAGGPPAKGQPCAVLDPKTVGTSSENVSCGKDFPKDEVRPGSEYLMEDAKRRIPRYHGARNNRFINSNRPARLLAAMTNVDDQLVLTMEALIRYASKYAGKGSTGDIGVDAFESALDAARAVSKGALSACHKFYNKVEQICQT